MATGQKTLFTWIGNTDLKEGARGEGPVATLLATGEFSRVHYFYTSDNEAQVKDLMAQLQAAFKAKLEAHPAALSPVDYQAIENEVFAVWKSLQGRIKPSEAAVNVTSGTPAMGAVMLYFGKTQGLEALSTVSARDARDGPRVRKVGWSFGPALRQAMAEDDQDSIVGLRPEDETDLRKLAGQEDVGLLIEGETGAGKSYLARRIHQWSGRKGPLIAINCAEFGDDQTMAVSRLFGHAKGSYTGAAADHEGYFRQAEGGTLFMDEVGELRPLIQSLLLTAIDEKKITPLHAKHSLPVDVRVIAATNRNLIQAVRDGKFRGDLYYRLAEFPVALWPLRETPLKEKLKLIDGLLAKLSQHHNRAWSLAPAARQRLAGHGWPGNIRQMKQALVRLCLLSDGLEIRDDRVEKELLRPVPEDSPTVAGPAPWAGRSLDEAVDIFRYQQVRAALDRHGDKKAAAAEALGLSPQTLNNYLKAGERLLGRGEV